MIAILVDSYERDDFKRMLATALAEIQSKNHKIIDVKYVAANSERDLHFSALILYN